MSSPVAPGTRLRRTALRAARWALLALALLAAAPAGALAQSGVADTPPARLLARETVEAVKVAVASAGALLLLWGWWLRRAGRPHRHRRRRDALLLALGLLGAACWGNLLQFRPGFVHGWDVYHYYMGAKYFRELGYTLLYDCGVVADAQDGLREQVRARIVRDLETDRMVRGTEVLARSQRCTDRFSQERWASFRRDVAWFRARMDPERWVRMHQDHGYNATPAWGAVGTTLASASPASWTQIVLLALLDPLLLAGMWAAVWWAFGWRAMCVALIYWGTNFPARFAWTGGSFLRQDWLALSIVGLCLLRRGHAGAAGFSLAWAAGLRLLPAWVLVGIALKWVTGWSVRPARPAGPWLALGLGAALATGIAVSLGAAVAGDWHAWVAFRDNSRKHLTSPLSNRMGLATLASYDHARRARLIVNPDPDDPERAWRNARRETFERRAPLFVAAALAFGVILAWAVRRQPDWTAALLGVGLIPVAGEATCYYYSILLAYGLVGDRREGIGAGLCALSAVGGAIAMFALREDELYALLSGVTLLFVVGATIALGRRAMDDPGARGARA